MKIANRLVEDATLVNLVVTKKGKNVGELRQHWTAKAGSYGYQIASRRWLGDEYSERITGGCGFDKCQDDFNSFLCDLFGRYVGYGGDVSWLLGGTKYHVGGNYYEIPFTVLRRMVKR